MTQNQFLIERSDEDDDDRPDGWQPGQTRAVVAVRVCPHCGSMRIRCKGLRSGQSLQRWSCLACTQEWVEQPDRRRVKGYIAP